MLMPRWFEVVFRAGVALFGVMALIVGIVFTAYGIEFVSPAMESSMRKNEAIIMLVTGLALLGFGPLMVRASVRAPLGHGLDSGRQSSSTDNRVILAALLAPPFGIATLPFMMAILLAVANNDSIAILLEIGYTHTIVYVVLVGLPVAYLVELLVALPAHVFFRGRLRPTVVIVVATAAGGATFAVPFGWVNLTDFLLWLGLGMVVGAVAGATYSWIAGISPEQASQSA